MTKIVIELSNYDDVILIKKIAERLKAKYKIEERTDTNLTSGISIDKLHNIIRGGVDVSNFGNPSDWQKKVRSDRSLNF